MIMKRTGFFVLILAAALLLQSCTALPNMYELLSYQRDGYTARARIVHGEEYTADIVSDGETITVSIVSPPSLNGVKYIYDDNLHIEYKGARAELINKESTKAYTWITMLMLDCGSLWKITPESVSGVPVYECETDGTTVYINRESKRPIRIVRTLSDGEISLDFISFGLSE